MSARVSEPRVVDGYDVEKLRRCLGQRGLLYTSADIVGVGAGGARVDLAGDHSVWVLPRWIEEARCV